MLQTVITYNIRTKRLSYNVKTTWSRKLKMFLVSYKLNKQTDARSFWQSISSTA